MDCKLDIIASTLNVLRMIINYIVIMEENRFTLRRDIWGEIFGLEL